MEDLGTLIATQWNAIKAAGEKLLALKGQVSTMVRRLAADDPWLAEKCVEHISLELAQHVAYAAAILACRSESPSLKARFKAAVAQGDMASALGLPELVEPRQWFRQLPAELLEYIEDMAVAHVHQLLYQFMEDLPDLQLDDEEWRQSLDWVLTETDELYCLQVCLLDAGRDRLSTVLQTLEYHGTAFLDALPRVRPLRNEQLRRAGLTDSWWARPFSW